MPATMTLFPAHLPAISAWDPAACHCTAHRLPACCRTSDRTGGTTTCLSLIAPYRTAPLLRGTSLLCAGTAASSHCCLFCLCTFPTSYLHCTTFPAPPPPVPHLPLHLPPPATACLGGLHPPACLHPHLQDYLQYLPLPGLEGFTGGDSTFHFWGPQEAALPLPGMLLHWGGVSLYCYLTGTLILDARAAVSAPAPACLIGPGYCRTVWGLPPPAACTSLPLYWEVLFCTPTDLVLCRGKLPTQGTTCAAPPVLPGGYYDWAAACTPAASASAATLLRLIVQALAIPVPCLHHSTARSPAPPRLPTCLGGPWDFRLHCTACCATPYACRTCYAACVRCLPATVFLLSCLECRLHLHCRHTYAILSAWVLLYWRTI